MATWCTATGTRLRAGAQAIWEGSGAVFQSGYEAIRKPDDPETFDEYLQTRDPLVAIKMRLNMIVKSFDNDILRTHINGMKWAVIDVSASPARFLLSDRPGRILQRKDPQGFTSLPKSLTKLFVAANSSTGLDKLRRVKPHDIVEHVNLFVVGRAQRFVWAQD